MGSIYPPSCAAAQLTSTALTHRTGSDGQMTGSTPVHPLAPAVGPLGRAAAAAAPDGPVPEPEPEPEPELFIKDAPYGPTGCTADGCTFRCYALTQLGVEATDVLLTSGWLGWFVVGWKGTPDGVAADYPGAVTLGLGPWHLVAALMVSIAWRRPVGDSANT